LSPERPKGGKSLAESIDGLKEFLKEQQDLGEDEIGGPRSDSVVSTYNRPHDAGAVEVARKNLARDPGNPQLKDWLAFNLYAGNQLDEAIALYEELLAAKPDNSEQRYYLGNCYYKKGLWQKAVQEWRRVCDLAPQSYRAKKAADRIAKLRKKMAEPPKA
jgi:tetratricopeptide (TPR) repeat protein